MLVGHHHLYERLTPLDANGRPSNLGIRQFPVGTGGRYLCGGNWLLISRAHEGTLFGILLLTLRDTGYAWQFEPQHGAVFTDYGNGSVIEQKKAVDLSQDGSPRMPGPPRSRT